MRLTVIGCAGSFAGPDSPASSYLLQVPAAVSPDGRDWNVVLDLGNGSLGGLQRAVDPRSLDAVCLSHLHPDHFVDLCGLYVYLRYHPDGPARAGAERLPLWGPSDTPERLAAAYGAEPGNGGGAGGADGGGAGGATGGAPFEEHFAFGTWRPGTAVRIGPVEIEPFAVFHPVEAYGLRVTGPSSVRPGERAVLAYTGDTDMCDALLGLAADADLLLAEAAFQEGRDDAVARGIHLTGRRAGALAAGARARELVLTHLPAWNDPAAALAEAGAEYPGPIALAAPGMVHEI